MEDSRWDNLIASLSYSERYDLYCHLSRVFGQHSEYPEHLLPSFDQTSIDPDRFSSAATLQPSGRSTPHGSSVSSENAIGLTFGLDPAALFAPGIRESQELPSRGTHADDLNAWRTSSAGTRLFRPPFPQHNNNEPAPRANSHEGPIVQTTGSSKGAYACIYCAELGRKKTLGTKQDWKRHLQDYHYGTGNEWHCQVKGCSKVCHRGVDFRKHLQEDHEGQKLPRDSKEIKQRWRVYGCGFEHCRYFGQDWKDFCDHVFKCMQGSISDWNYTRTIRNLLKQTKISEAWKSVYYRLCSAAEITPSKSLLQWDPTPKTMAMRRQLEFHIFEPSLQHFLEELFRLGLPNQTASDAFMGASVAPPTYLPLLPPTLGQSNLQPAPSPFGSTLPYGMYDPSLDPTSGYSDGQLEHDDNPSPSTGYDKRMSVVMTDAAPLPDIHTTQVPLSGQHAEMIDGVDQDDMSVSDFLNYNYAINTTPPCDPIPLPGGQHAPLIDMRRSPRRTLVRKSREWLNSKKSQHSHQPSTIDHPDWPSNQRLPTSAPRKTPSKSPPCSGGARIYNYQS